MSQEGSSKNNKTSFVKKSFKDTLNLPRTEFPIRANAEKFDAEILQRWQDDNLFYKSFIHNKGNAKFILHDGPPYANGNIHLGHAYNKILKDILCKFKRMLGYQVPVTPGWDCHGLPIELKVKQDNPNLDKLSLMKACRTYAQGWIDIQRDQFKQLGVLMNWSEPYVTMDPAYESDIVQAFGQLIDHGFIERKNKTVPWCFSCETVLASAEIEYQDRKDPSVYVLFNLNSEYQKKLFPDIESPISLLMWTTTPWTIPLNRALMLKTKGDYSLVDYDGQLVIVGSKLVDSISQMSEKSAKVLKNFSAEYLTDAKVDHPITGRETPIIFEDTVGTDEGTAVVHTAPGCGPIDYEIGVKNKLEIYSPISSCGTYTSEIIPKELVGMPVSDGQIWVIKNLAHNNKLFAKKSIKHSYPHCWRCRSGLIFRATPQWFFDLDRYNTKQKALEAVENIKFIPERGRNFLRATIENRWEWCLSRQRTWGAPIPAILCKGCDYSYTSKALAEIVAQGIKEEGIEYWTRVSLDEILEKLKQLGQKVSCPGSCSNGLVKEQDILDVWFDSGVSHYAVLYKNKELAFPADIYLEGVDQYRGWFQSSLLTSLVLEKTACMKSIMAHGFTVDEKGRKMSKSIGNVVSPDDIIKKFGTDGLRLWVSSIGHNGDAVISDVLLKNVAEVYRKIRNTARFLLSNLYDFDIDSDAVNFEDLLYVDRYALLKLNDFNKLIIQEYNNYNFTSVYHKLADYCTGELSSFYLDIIKDRLYVAQAGGVPRKSAQTVAWYILDSLTKLMAPILSFTAELISDYYQKDKKESIHLQSFNDLDKVINQKNNDEIWPGFMQLNNSLDSANSSDKYALWSELKDIRDVVLKAIEIERQKGDIKHSLEAKVKLYIDSQDKFKAIKQFIDKFDHKYQTLEEFLKEIFIISQLELLNSSDNLIESSVPGVYVEVSRAQGQKCPRCWNWSTEEHPDDLCKRCELVVNL